MYASARTTCWAVVNLDTGLNQARIHSLKVQQATGKLVDSKSQEAKGIKRQVEGVIQKGYGDAQEAVKDAREAVKDAVKAHS